MFKKLKKNIIRRVKSNYQVDKFLYLKRLQKNFPKHKPFLYIYTMGKVGSTSIFESLKSLSNTYNVLHFHRLSIQYLKEREAYIKKNVYNNKSFPRHVYTDLLWKPRWIRNKVLDATLDKLVITAIREPIGRNISLFFQWMDFSEEKNGYIFKSRNKNFDFEIRTDKDDLTALYDYFLNEFTRDSHLEWLEKELYEMFSFDIYEEPFEKLKGYQIRKGKDYTILILKLESLNSCYTDAIRDFLNEEVTLTKANEANSKEIQDIYLKFKNEIVFSEPYVESLYNSKYMHHFYTDKEIDNFKKKWNITK